MIKPILSFFVLFVCFANAAQAQLKTTKLDSAQVPKSIKYTGKFNSALRWTDQLGDNLVVTVETVICTNKPPDVLQIKKCLRSYSYALLRQACGQQAS